MVTSILRPFKTRGGPFRFFFGHVHFFCVPLFESGIGAIYFGVILEPFQLKCPKTLRTWLRTKKNGSNSITNGSNFITNGSNSITNGSNYIPINITNYITIYIWNFNLFLFLVKRVLVNFYYSSNLNIFFKRGTWPRFWDFPKYLEDVLQFQNYFILFISYPTW